MIDIETKLRNMTMPKDVNEPLAECINKLNIAKHLTPTKIDGFKFPRPPNVPPIRPHSSSSTCGCSSDSDTQSDCKSRRRMRRTCPISINRNNIRTHENLSSSPKTFSACLPPIGVFWDIENCNVPRGCSAVTVAQVIRSSFFEGYREAEFIVVCDVTKEHGKVIEELNDAQVSLVHVPALHKNAADEKLRQAMRRFADTHGAPAAIVLITSDINFLSDVCDLRHRHKIHVILLHRSETAEALLVCANEAYNIETVFERLPQRDLKPSAERFQVVVSNLPAGLDGGRLRNRLRRVSDNCGGRVAQLDHHAATATLTFSTRDLAQRAQKRMQGADVFGNKICVGTPVPFEKENGKIETEDERLGSESPQVMAGSGNGRNSMSHYAGAFGNAGANLFGSNPFGDVGWNASPQLTAADQFRNGQHIPAFPSRLDRSHWTPTPSISVTYTVPLPPAGAPGPFRARLSWVGGGVAAGWRPHRELGIFHRVIDETTFTRCLHVAMEYNGFVADSRQPNNPNNPLNQLSKKLPLQNGHGDAGGGGDSKWQPGEKLRINNGRAKTPDQMRSIVKTRHDRDDLYVAPPATASAGAANGGRGRNGQPAPRRPSPNEQGNGRPGESSISSASSDDEHESEVVELHVSNLDPKMKMMELKAMIHRLFGEYVNVVHVSVMTQADGKVGAQVRVQSAQDAQEAIAQFHRRKVGGKRLLISRPGHTATNRKLLRSRIVSLLSAVPSHTLSLVLFFDLFESRFCTSVGLADVHKLRDVCSVVDDGCSPSIRLKPGQACVAPQTELGQCAQHGALSDRSVGWAEVEEGGLPSVSMSLSTLAHRVTGLLATHDGSLPLASLARCHDAMFGPLPVPAAADAGVPLEHLVACVAGVEIHAGPAGKVLRWRAEGGTAAPGAAAGGASSRLADQQAQLSREIVELLKKFPRCQLAFGRLIPAYHHHFSRQCRVADYGFTKLADLLDSMADVVQVMGVGERREVTLSHRVQMRRFTADVLRVLKAQASRQVPAAKFAAAFKQVTARDWDVLDYGVCHLTDLLDALNKTSVTVSETELGTVLSIPRRSQTPAEIAKTAQFANQVAEMLWLSPQYRIAFVKFVPTYHHFFGQQCRVADMGFNKLVELLEAIGHVAQLNAEGGERYVTLNADLALAALGQQVGAMLAAVPSGYLLVADIPAAFRQRYGFAVCPEAFGCSSLLQLMQRLRDAVMVVDSGFGGPMAMPVDRGHLRQLALKAWRVLAENGAALAMPAPHFLQAYWRAHGEVANLDTLAANLESRVKVFASGGSQHVQLTPAMVFAAEAYRAVCAAGGSLPWPQLERLYRSAAGATPPADLAAAVADVLLVGADNVATLQPALAEAGLRLPPVSAAAAGGNGHREVCSASQLLPTFKPSSLLGDFVPDQPVQSEQAEADAPSGIWNFDEKRETFSPFGTCDDGYVGLPIRLPPSLAGAGNVAAVKRSMLELTSPAKTLLHAHLFPRGYESPAPSKLPMPTALTPMEPGTPPPRDAVLNGDSGCGADLDASACSSLGSAGKHKRRLAAQFPLPTDK